MDLLSVLGTGAGIVGGFMESRAKAKARKRAMQFLRQLIAQQNQDFASAKTSIQKGAADYEADPQRAQVAAQWQDRLAHPDVLSPADESVLLQQGLDQGAREGAQTGAALNEDATRRGLGNSPLAVGLRAAAMSRSLGAAQGINVATKLKVKTTNRAAKDDLLNQYGEYADKTAATRYGFSSDLANLYGSRTYGNSALLAGVGA